MIKLHFRNTVHIAVHQLIPIIIVWILCTSPEVRKVDAACQVHVWHVSRGYTIISSSSLSEFIVLNFCPSLNMRWKHGIQLRLVNGSLSEGICGLFFVRVCVCVFSLQITNHLFPCLARQQLVEISKKKSDEHNKNVILIRAELICIQPRRIWTCQSRGVYLLSLKDFMVN